MTTPPIPKPTRGPTPRPVTTTELALPGKRSGKVRDVYPLPAAEGRPAALALIATDRISAFDVVMPTPIPGKGVILTQIAAFWLRWIEERGLAKTHLLSTDHTQIPGAALTPETTADDLAGRTMIGRACRVLPVECVVRGYLEGSGWAEYQMTQSVCGIALPAGLTQCAKLPEPIFTPATKAEQGEHDENIDFAAAANTLGDDMAARLRNTSLAIYSAAAEHAAERGIILADTKFEFGIDEATGDLLLIDEALTPDSSRFWPAEGFEPGHAQPSFDKQFVREHLQSLVDAGSWNKAEPGPTLPDDVVIGTRDRYQSALDRLTT